VGEVEVFDVGAGGEQAADVDVLDGLVGVGELEGLEGGQVELSEQFRKVHHTVSSFKVS